MRSHDKTKIYSQIFCIEIPCLKAKILVTTFSVKTTTKPGRVFPFASWQELTLKVILEQLEVILLLNEFLGRPQVFHKDGNFLRIIVALQNCYQEPQPLEFHRVLVRKQQLKKKIKL